MLRVLYYKPDLEPSEIYIEGTLEELQELVGGMIEVVPLGNNFLMICNEEGILLNLPINRVVKNHLIKGSFIICKENRDSGEFEGLTDEEVEIVLEIII